MLLKAVDKVFLAVVAAGIGNFADGLLGRGEQVLGLVDATQDNILIGRIACARLECARKMRLAQVDRSGDLLHGQRLVQMAVHIADGLRDAVALVGRCAGFIQQQQAEQAVDQLRTGGLARALVRRAAAQQSVQQARDLMRGRRRKHMAAAARLQDAAVKITRVQAVEQQPGELHAVRGGIAVGLAAVKYHSLSGSSQRGNAVQHKLHGARLDQEQHDILVVVTLARDFGLVIEGIQAAAKIVAAARWIVKKFARKRGRREKVPLRGLMHAAFRNQHGGLTPFPLSYQMFHHSAR